MDNLFDVLCIASETKLLKPNKDAFMDFVNKLGVLPEELVFVDDSVVILNKAKELGMATILCDDPSNLHKQFEEMGI